MALTLSISKSPPGVAIEESQKSFSEAGGTIGRGEGNDWILNDPDRFLSSRHCQISYEAGQYFVTDISTNGTFINGAAEPLGKGSRTVLGDGDTIELGDYQFHVKLAAAAKDNAFADNQTGDPFADEDPFGDPLTRPMTQQDPFVGDPFANKADILGVADLPLNSEPLEVDPLAALDKAGAGNSVPMEGGQNSDLGSLERNGLGSESAGSLADLFASEPRSNAVPQQSQDDGVDALQQSLDWPGATSSDEVIPENWDDDLLGSEPLSPRAGAPMPEKNKPTLEKKQDFGEVHRSMPLTDPPKMAPTAKPKPKVKNPRPLEEPLLAERPPEKVETFRSKPKAKARPEPREKAPPRETRADRQELAQSLGEVLLDGMGLTGKNLSREEIGELYQAVGALIPVVVNGMMQVLRSRASIKNEFRMNVTTIQPVENNPLKFSADVDEAIANMFLRKSSAYLGPKEAFEEGFNSIGEHQVAIIAGIRAAFKSMMERFNPELLERQFEKQNQGVVFPGMKSAKYWNSYVDYYNAFVDNMENTFQYLFGDEFVQAYEDQLRRLAVERKTKQRI